MSNETFSIYIPLSKIEDQPDGTILVWGRATQEVPDSDGEICDYASSVPLFQRRSQMMRDASNGENLFPLRSMHQRIAAGKVIEMSYLAEDKAIDICAKVVDANEVNKVRERVYTGFSVAGNYARKWKDPSSRHTRFTADPREISLVDVPSVPTARLTLFKMDGDLPDEQTVVGGGYAEPAWVVNFIKSVDRLEGIKRVENEEREVQFSKLRAIGERVGIERRDDSPITAPNGHPLDPDEYGDPANWAFPVEKGMETVAVFRFNEGIGADQYSPRSRHVLGRRIARLASRFDKIYKYDSASKKIISEKEGEAMSDKVQKLDIGGLMSQMKAARDIAADQITRDPEAAKAALDALMGDLDALVDTGSTVLAGGGAPSIDAGMVVKVEKPDPSTSGTSTTPSIPAKKVEDVAPVEKVAAPSDPDAGNTSPSDKDKLDAQKAEIESRDKMIVDQKADIAKLGEALGKATKILEKFSFLADSPAGDLAALVGHKNSALEDPIVKALMDGGPYAYVKALKAAGGDDEFTGSMAFAAVNNAIRKATYETLEEGGIVTASRFQGRIWSPTQAS